jgi:hypothetical protein
MKDSTMHSADASLPALWGSISWVLLGCAGIVGFVALVSPKTFRSLADLGGRWLDSEKLLARLDKRIDIDRMVLPYSRWLGAAVLATVAILCLRATNP